MTPLQEKLFEALEDLSPLELLGFKQILQFTDITKGLPRLPEHRLEMAGRVEIVKLMEEIYGQQCVELIRKVLKKMNRSDLVQRLSDISSGSEGELLKKQTNNIILISSSVFLIQHTYRQSGSHLNLCLF